MREGCARAGAGDALKAARAKKTNIRGVTRTTKTVTRARDPSPSLVIPKKTRDVNATSNEGDLNKEGDEGRRRQDALGARE